MNAKHAATIGAFKARIVLPVDLAFMGFTSLSNGSCVSTMQTLSARRQFRFGQRFTLLTQKDFNCIGICVQKRFAIRHFCDQVPVCKMSIKGGFKLSTNRILCT
jgi:hypothetical protein